MGLAKAIEEVREGRREPTPGRIVAALTLSFWTAIEMTGWLCPAAADWCEAHSRFLEAYPPAPIILHRNGDRE